MGSHLILEDLEDTLCDKWVPGAGKHPIAWGRGGRRKGSAATTTGQILQISGLKTLPTN